MRTLKAIDDDIRRVRSRLMDSVKGTSRWKTAWDYLDKLLDERNAHLKYAAKHAKGE
jgi:hypothetical protein